MERWPLLGCGTNLMVELWYCELLEFAHLRSKIYCIGVQNKAQSPRQSGGTGPLTPVLRHY